MNEPFCNFLYNSQVTDVLQEYYKELSYTPYLNSHILYTCSHSIVHFLSLSDSFENKLEISLTYYPQIL